MDVEEIERWPHGSAPFNTPLEVGLRALCVLTAAFPEPHGLHPLTTYDYMLVHSSDFPNGPPSLHPQTPYRAGELLTRRGVLQEGLLLFQSRGLIERRFEPSGVLFVATERSAAFLDVLATTYVDDLRNRARWVIETFGDVADARLDAIVGERLGEWGTEFTMQSVLMEGTP